MYQLKKGQEAFTLVEGPLAGRTYKPGERYQEIPRELSGRFTAIKAVPAPPEPLAEDAKPKTEKKPSA